MNGLVWVLRDQNVHPLEFDHHPFVNNDSPKDPLPSPWMTSHANPIRKRVGF